MSRAREWFESAFGLDDERLFPITFGLGAADPHTVMSDWQADIEDRGVARVLTFTDAHSGLSCRCEARLFDDFPAVEWVGFISNAGRDDSPVIENILPLDWEFGADTKTPCELHHAKGSDHKIDDFAPLTTPLPPRSDARIGSYGGRSSNGSLPFFNLVMGDGGIIGAVGWTGDWFAHFLRNENGAIQVRSGMPETHLRLRPGEQIRTPRMLLLFWEGDVIDAHNTLRRFILAHHTPRPGSALFVYRKSSETGKPDLETSPRQLLRLEDTCIKPNPDFSQLRKAILREGKPRFVPFYELFVNPEIQNALLGRQVQGAADTVEFYYRAGYDYVPAWPIPGWVFGDLVDRRKGYPITDWQSFEQYPWPKPESISYAQYEECGKALRDGMMMIAQTGGVLECAEQLVGYEQLCFALMDDPPFCEALFKRIEDVYVAMYSAMASIEKVGACVISDDLGFKTQTLISAADLRKYVLPVHKRLARIIHDAGKPVILHSCGNLSQIMEDLIRDVGIDAKHSYEDAILPVEKAAELYGGRIAILGGFDVDRLCRSTQDQVRAYTRKLVSELGADGGYALGSGNSIAAYVPIANYLAMIDEGWKARL